MPRFGQRGSVQGTTPPPTNPLPGRYHSSKVPASAPGRDPMLAYLNRPIDFMWMTPERWNEIHDMPDPDRNPMPSTTQTLGELLQWIDRLSADPGPVCQVAVGEMRTCIRDHVWTLYDESLRTEVTAEVTAEPEQGPLTLHVSAEYRLDAASRKIAEIVEYLDPDSIRGGILIVPTTFKEQ